MNEEQITFVYKSKRNNKSKTKRNVKIFQTHLHCVKITELTYKKLQVENLLTLWIVW